MKQRIFVIALSVAVAVIVFVAIMNIEQESSVIRGVVVYNPSTSIGSLYEGHRTFEEVDRSQPEGVLFCKTRAESAGHVEQLYTASANNSEYMNMISARERSAEFREAIGQKNLLFSFYYHGDHGPPHWFCIIDSIDGPFRSAVFMELENGLWRQCTDIGKYPVRIALFDLARGHELFDANHTLGRKEIDAFIKDCEEIDRIIASRMAEDPEHYGPVLILR